MGIQVVVLMIIPWLSIIQMAMICPEDTSASVRLCENNIDLIQAPGKVEKQFPFYFWAKNSSIEFTMFGNMFEVGKESLLQLLSFNTFSSRKVL